MRAFKKSFIVLFIHLISFGTMNSEILFVRAFTVEFLFLMIQNSSHLHMSTSSYNKAGERPKINIEEITNVLLAKSCRYQQKLSFFGLIAERNSIQL